jgi:superfamily I DNA and/or RNA helicase
MLNTQRRMVVNIAEIVNKSFYKGQLITASNVQHYKYKDLINQGHVEFIEMGTSNPEYKSEFSRSRSRYNKFNRLRVLELLTEILTLHPGANIGIITPYAQQVADYKIDLEEQQWESVLVGTIHSFQGSECDIIIWDMVDTINDSIGKLYKGETGERLVNVAISRAISKLIVVGNHRVFNEAQGYNDVTSRLKRVASFCWEEAKFQ